MTGPGKSASSAKTSRQRALSLLTVTLSAIALLQSGIAAAEWNFDPILRAAWDFDDNATLSPRTDAEEDISGYIAEASVDFRYNSENAFLSMRPILRTRGYGSNSDRDSDDGFFKLFGVYDGVKSSFRISGDFSQESVRTAELADADLDTNVDPDDIADDQSGVVDFTERRDRYRLTPRWTYRFSDISSIETSLTYLTVGYDEDEVTNNLFDFTDMRFSVGYRRNFSDRNIAVFSATARDYDTDRFGGDRKTYGLEGGFVRRLSETTQFRAKVGIESVDAENTGPGSIDIDPEMTFDVSLLRRLKTIHLLAQYRQRISATGQGGLTQRDELNLRFTRDLNDRFTAGLGVRAYSNTTISGIVNEQDFVQLRGQVVWRISRRFSMQGDYRHTVLDEDGPEGAADSNRITLWLSYQPNPVGRDSRLELRF